MFESHSWQELANDATFSVFNVKRDGDKKMLKRNNIVKCNGEAC